MLRRGKDGPWQGAVGMTISWFLTVQHPTASLDAAARQAIETAIGATAGVEQALLFTPSATSDPYLDDGRPPLLAMQVDFSGIVPLETALGIGGSLAGLPNALAAIAGADVREQAMLTRRYGVPDPTFRTPAGSSPCTYLVAYYGQTEDLNAWHRHYIAHHPPIMGRFPGIRQIEIHTCIDWCSALPFRRGDAFQRNKVVFDDQAALTAALNSPVRHEMRADFKDFPKFSGANTHYPMDTHTVVGVSGALS
jgi:uncharacterized protein (TIGR02118 family)